MGYLLLKSIDTDNIKINESKYSYKISYISNNIISNGIHLRINHITINKNSTNYIIIIHDKNSLSNLYKLNSFLQDKLSCESFIQNNSLIFKQNDIINRLIKPYVNMIDINIYVIRKNAYQTTPIVYIL